MSLISSRLSLTHRCVIERDASAGTANARGNPQAPDWQPHLTDLPCRTWTTNGNESVRESEAIVGVEDARVIVQVGTDVTRLDRIGQITDRGDIVVAGPVEIRAVLHHRDHLELVLVQVGS